VSPTPSSDPHTLTLTVADDGSFTTPLELTEGRWSITVVATSPEGKTASLTRTVTVAYVGVNLVVTITGDIRHSRVARSAHRALTTLGIAELRIAGPLEMMPDAGEFGGARARRIGWPILDHRHVPPVLPQPVGSRCTGHAETDDESAHR